MSYENFASFYDIFTRDVDYRARAKYIAEILKRGGIEGGILLDLACGTGSLSIELCKYGYDVIGIDNSPEMLSAARERCEEKGILLLCQDMTRLDLYGTINCCVCSLDSINHLTGEAEVAACFNGVSLFMERGGIFVFDLNTPYKHRHILADNDFIFEEDGIFCAWHNEADKESGMVDIYLDFFRETDKGLYERFSECITERAYTMSTIKKLLINAGFRKVEFFSDMTQCAPKRNDERICCVAVK